MKKQTTIFCSLVLALLATAVSAQAATVPRGPYLQKASADNITVRWRTDVATDSRVWFGTSPGSPLAASVDDATVTTEHVVELTGLSAQTTYYYAVGSTSEILAGDNDPTYFFKTPPIISTDAPTRIWVIGDSGTADGNARAVRDAYSTYTGSTHTDLWLMLGDNAYNSGTDLEYEAAVFDTYPEMLRKSVVWPTLGNHDGVTANSSTQSGPYYDIFSLPTVGECGGAPSGTEAYYSFDHANIHFIVLDSQESDRVPPSTMLDWLIADLQSTAQDWIIAYWHHPPYSKGSHNSDSETTMIQMRENVLPILDDYGVDLTLSGHSHSYERSFLIDGFYDTPTIVPGDGTVIDPGSGKVEGSGAYVKPASGPMPHSGTVHTVAGSSGKLSGGSLDHPVMYVSLNQLGSVVLDIDGDRLDAAFLTNTGSVTDHYTILKGTNCNFSGVCDPGEDCTGCPDDCPQIVAASCNDGVCDAGAGEDCVSCPADCAGKQNGKPTLRFCCGDGDGVNPVSCSDSRCTSGPLACETTTSELSCCGDLICEGEETGFDCAIDCGDPPICGDATCDPDETPCNCAEDCGAPPAAEDLLTCDDGEDNDCDEAVDCDDPDCDEIGDCGGTCLILGEGCASDIDCCSTKCRGKSGAKTCK